MANPERLASGFAMVEVLVSIVIILIGLLGLAGLQTRAQEAEMESYQRAQALILLQDMVDRINANRQTAPCYAITDGAGMPFLGTSSPVAIGCFGYGDANTQAQAVADMTEWQDLLLGASETLGANSVGAMLGARGCITLTDPARNVYTIAVAWQGLTQTAAPAVACGNNLYGDEMRRRVVWTTLQIADLM